MSRSVWLMKLWNLFAIPLRSWLGLPTSKLYFEKNLCLILGFVHLEDAEKAEKVMTRLQPALYMFMIGL